MTYILLFWEFFKMGLFSFGGGMATIPFLYTMAEKYTWFSKDVIMDMIAIAESTPGPIGVNMATYAGYKAAGLTGAIVSTFSLVIPSLILVVIVAKVLEKFKENRYLKSVIEGLQPAVIGLIIAVFLDILKVGLFAQKATAIQNLDFKFIAVFLFFLLLLSKKDVNMIIYFILAGIVGVACCMV